MVGPISWRTCLVLQNLIDSAARATGCAHATCDAYCTLYLSFSSRRRGQVLVVLAAGRALSSSPQKISHPALCWRPLAHA